MKIAWMDEINMDHFAEMIPSEFLKTETSKKRACLVATQENEETGFDEPAAVLIFFREDDRFVLEWMYVQEENRGSGIGEHLLVKVCDAAARLKLPYVSVLMCRDVNGDLIWPQDEEYARAHLFLYEEPFDGELPGKLWQEESVGEVSYSLLTCKTEEYIAVRSRPEEELPAIFVG